MTRSQPDPHPGFDLPAAPSAIRRQLAERLSADVPTIARLTSVVPVSLAASQDLAISLADRLTSTDKRSFFSTDRADAAGLVARRLAVFSYRSTAPDESDVRIYAQQVQTMLGEYARDGSPLYTDFAFGEEPDTARFGSLRSLTAIPERLPDHLFHAGTQAFCRAQMAAATHSLSYGQTRAHLTNDHVSAHGADRAHNVMLGMAVDTGGIYSHRAPLDDAAVAEDRSDRDQVALIFDGHRATIASALDTWPNGGASPGRSAEIASGIARSLRYDGSEIVEIDENDTAALKAIADAIRVIGVESDERDMRLVAEPVADRVQFAANAVSHGRPVPGVLRVVVTDSAVSAMEMAMHGASPDERDSVAEWFMIGQILVSDMLAGLAEELDTGPERAAYMFPARAAEIRGYTVLQAARAWGSDPMDLMF